MRHSLLLLVFCSIWRCVCAAVVSRDHLELEPISDDGWDGSLQRRSGFTYSKVHLQENEHFVWGSPASANRTVYVNMTVGTKDNELIISMERFASQLKSVNCSEEDMAMTFISNATYQHAIKSWDWVNFSENRTFIMIANYPGCGKDNSRSPWLVSNVYYDPQNLHVTLNSTKKTWEEAAHTYALDFGHYAPPAPASVQGNGSLAKRWTFDKSFPLDLNHQMPSSMFVGINTGGFNLDVSCPNCATTGQLVLAGHVEVKFFGGLKAFTVSATPQGIGAALNLAVKVGGTLPVGGFTQSINLATLDLGGFSIPGILTLGPTFNIDAGFGLSSLSGSATFSAGVTASIPDSSTAQVDLTGNQASDISGWTPTFSTTPLTVDAQIAVGVDVFTKLSIAASVLVLGNGFSVSLGLKVPDVSLKAVANFDPAGGACPGSTKTIGVALDASIGAVLELQGYTEAFGTQSLFLNDPLFTSGAAFTWQPICYAFGPDAPSAAASTTAAAATTSATIATTSTTYSSTTLVSAAPQITQTPVSNSSAPITSSDLSINTSVHVHNIGSGSELTSSAMAATPTASPSINTSDSFNEVGTDSKCTSSTAAAAPAGSGTPKIGAVHGAGGWNSTVEEAKEATPSYVVSGSYHGRHKRSMHRHSR